MFQEKIKSIKYNPNTAYGAALSDKLYYFRLMIRR